MLVEAFASVLVLLASVTSVIVWVSIHIARWASRTFSSKEKSDRRRVPRPANQWDPNHPLFSKRAGQ